MKWRLVIALMIAASLMCICIKPAQIRANEPAATKPATKPAEIDQLTPRGAWKMFNTVANNADAAAMAKIFDTQNAEQEKVVKSWCDYGSASASLLAALETKFPPAGMDVSAMRAADLKNMLAHIDEMQETITGDDAVLGPPGRPAVVKFKRIDGKWKIAYDAYFNGIPTRPENIAILDMQTAVKIQLTADVKADKFKSLQEVDDAFHHRLEAAAKSATATQPTTQP